MVVAQTLAKPTEHSARNDGGLIEVPIAWIRPSLLNPRKHFDEAALAELAESIKQHGLLEPLVVRHLVDPNVEGTAFELIAGERRWRACKIAGVETVPVRDLGEVDDATALQLAIVENLQRKDLDPIEEAEGYRQLNEVVGLKQAAIAAAVNRSQPAIANRMRLLELPDDVRELIRDGKLSPAHGVALARFSKFPELLSVLATDAVTAKWTSKDLEQNSILHSWSLRDRKLVTDTWRVKPETRRQHCEKCPFDAYRKIGNGDGLCLNPAHYQELVFDQEKRDNAVVADAVEKVKAADPAAADLPLTGAMTYGSYENLRYTTPPPGCGDNCPCRARAIDVAHGIVPICTDPKRFKKLQTQQKRAESKTRKADSKRMAAALDRRIDAIATLDDVGPREIAVLAKSALSPYGYGVGSMIRDAYTRIAGGQPRDEKGDQRNVDFLKAADLERLDPATVLKAVVEGVVRQDIKGYAEENTAGDLAKWYLDWSNDGDAP